MNGLVRGLTSSVGLKFLMALTGLLLVLFLIGHLVGNSFVYGGRDALNAYAGHLQDLGGLLWVVRLGLLTVFAVHVLTATVLQFHNWASRPVGYARQKALQSTFFSRTMIWSGLLILVFLGYHLLHFTLHATNPGHVEEIGGHTDVYSMVIRGFREPTIAIPYVLAMILLGFHLFHGIGSLFQSMGWNHPRYEGLYQGLAKTLAVILVVGNVLMPLMVLLGVIGKEVQ